MIQYVLTVLFSMVVGGYIVNIIKRRDVKNLKNTIQNLMRSHAEELYEARQKGFELGANSRAIPNWNEHTRPDDRLWPPA